MREAFRRTAGQAQHGEADATRDAPYRDAAAVHGAAIVRLAAGYEADADLRHDLVQDIHVALWRSLAGFDGRCSLRTWVYRVAHNVAASHVRRHSRGREILIPLHRDGEEADNADDSPDPERQAGARLDLDRLLGLIRRLRPPDRQIMLLYLEDMEAAAIGEIVGLSAGAVATRLHRIRKTLSERMTQGGSDAQ